VPLARLKDININYEVEGKGDPLIMIMGFTASRSGWMSQIPFFKKYFRVITFDNRGVGKSGKPPGPYSTTIMAEDTARLMDYLQIEKAHIIGASMGGMIAQELAINYPNRVIKLVLASTYARPAEPNEITQEQAELAQLNDTKMANTLVGMAFNKPFYRITFGLLDSIQTRFIGAAGMVGIAGQRAACASHNTLDRLQSITAPTLVIVGSEDRIINPVSSEVIAGKIPDARLVKVEGGSHSFSLEMKKAFNQIVRDFLEDKPV
jgi:pimeloyl-ACP methyl ester carboxylesterase